MDRRGDPNAGSVHGMPGFPGQPQYYQASPGPASIPGNDPEAAEGHTNMAAAAGPSGATSPIGGGGSSGSHPKPIRRRMRMITSCLECRRRKLKCNKSQPCTNCMKFSRDCLYLGPKLDEAGQLRLTEMKEKVGSLERQLERVVAKSTSRATEQQRILADDVEDEYAEEKDLEPTDMTALDVTYEDDADVTDDLIDLGVQVGRMRITERIGGLSRPRIAEEISAGISGQRPPPGFGGPPPPFAGGSGHPPRGFPAFPGGGLPGMDAMSTGTGSEGSIPDFLKPSASYIPPSGGFFFGHTSEVPSLEKMLPTREAGDRLIQQYFTAVHPIARCVHRPTFEADYQGFWDDIYANYEPRPSMQAVVFAAWFSAAVSMNENMIVQLFQVTKALLIEKLKLSTEAALSRANFLRTTRVETMQGFVMYMIPLCRAEVSRAHSVLVGAAVRMAECMGLHRDGETYGLNPLDTHVRRLIWHQLCFLDIRTCEAQGPRPAIRREDYDTRLPINCEEAELIQAVAPPESADGWTSTLLPLIRFEINEMMRIIWMDRRKLETRRTTLAAVLTKIENFRKRMLEKYDRFLDDRIPLQRYAKLVMHLLLYRLHAMVLHPYHANANSPMPHRLNNVLIMSGVLIIEIAIQLETDHLFRDWAWYLGAYQQFQIALLLATEVYYRPNTREAPRIWACLDYVFNMDRNLPPEAKGLHILGEIMGKMSIYQGMRKMRAPTGTSRAAPNKYAVAGKAPVPAEASLPSPMQHLNPHAPVPGMPMGLKTEPGLPGPSVMNMAPPAHNPMGPPPNIVFAGVSNGEALWSVPPVNHDSPENSSDGGSVAGAHGPRLVPQMGSMNNPMEGEEWDAIEALFPRDPSTGELNMPGFHDPSIGMSWHR